MQRPFAVIGFTWLGVLIAASYAGFGLSTALAIFCSICAAVVILCFQKEKRRLPAAIFLAAAAAFAAFSFAEFFWYTPAAALGGKNAVITGKIAEAPSESYGSYYYTIKADSITVNGKRTSVKTKIRLQSTTELDAEPFDNIAASVKLTVPGTKNAYGYNSRQYYKSKGIYLFANNPQNITITKTASKPPYYYAIQLRQYISGALNSFVGGQRGHLAAGILIGDTSGLDETIKSDFSDCGISHILAVSGTQTSLIMEYLMLLLCFFRLPKKVSASITTGTIIVFMAVTGFSPSVMRAGVMAVLCMCAVMIKRDADVLNSLGFSAFILCAVNPYAATDVGFLLSFFATLGMATVSKRLNAYLKEKTERLPGNVSKIAKVPLGVLCETIGASLLTYPIIILVFGRVSLVSLAANIFEVPVSLFVTLAAAVLAIFSPFWFLVFLIKPLAILIRISCAFMIWFAHILASLPFAAISAEYGFVDILIVFAVLLFVLYLVFRKKGAQSAVCVTCACFAVSVGVFSFMIASHGVMTVKPVGNSGSAVVMSNGHAVLIDIPTGVYNSQTVIENYLKAKNINYLDAVVLTSVDDKKIQALAALKGDINVGHIYMPQNVGSESIENAEKIGVPSKINAPYGVNVTMLPDKTKTGLMTLVSCASSKAVITGSGKTGDYSGYDDDWFKANLLVFGNSLAPDFAGKVSPENVVCSGNTSTGTISELLTDGASIVTDDCSYLTRGGGSYKIVYY